MSNWIVTVPAAVVGLAVGLYQLYLMYRNTNRGYYIGYGDHSGNDDNDDSNDHGLYSNRRIIPNKDVNGHKANKIVTRKFHASVRVKQVEKVANLKMHYK